MRADHIRIYKSVHTWTGIVSGMALFIAFYAGALTVFKEPIERWASPPAPAPAQQVPLDQVPQLIARTIGDHPAVARGFTIHVRENEGIPARMAWDVRDPGAGDHDELGEGAVRCQQVGRECRGSDGQCETRCDHQSGRECDPAGVRHGGVRSPERFLRDTAVVAWCHLSPRHPPRGSGAQGGPSCRIAG